MEDEGQPYSVFLSYAHADAARATKVARLLSAQGHEVWWDTLIEGGAQFAQRIAEALDRADVVVVLWSAASVQSDWVRDEAAQARGRGRLVPVSLDGSEPPLGFRQYQTIDLSRWRGQARSAAATRLLEAVSAAAAGRPPPVVEAAPARGWNRRTVLAGAAGTAVLTGAGVVGWQRLGQSAPDDQSIAVLPFKNLSGDAAQDYFAEGLAEEIRSTLMRIPALKVLGTTSSNEAGGEDADARSVARKLDVAYLLQGSVRREGERLRISTELTDGSTGFSAWRQEVERRAADIFAVQTEIARMVAQAMSLQLATDDPAPGGTENVAAFEAYLRGKSLFNLAKDEASDRAARAQFEIALAADPKFALARAALSRVLSAIGGQYAPSEEIKATYALAKAEAEKAVALAPTLAEAHLALGFVRFAGSLDVRGAAEAYDAAYRYGNRNADIILLYALYIVRNRRFAEARAAIERALALDPINARTWRAAATIAVASRRFADALPLAARALQLNPKITNAHAMAGNALLLGGKLPEAIREYEAEPLAMTRLTGLAIAEHRRGNAAAARGHLAALTAELGDSALYQQAQVLSQFGDKGAALDRLERAFALNDSGLIYLITDPFLDPVSGDPRFRRLAARMGFG